MLSDDLRTYIAENAVASLEGARISSLVLSVGHILLIDVSGPRGKAYLRVESPWRLEREQVLVACEDPRPEIAKAIAGLEGASVASVTVSLPSLDLALGFADGSRLLTFGVSALSSKENWTIHTVSGEALVSGPGRLFSVQPRT
jgi:hypothetical protein